MNNTIMEDIKSLLGEDVEIIPGNQYDCIRTNADNLLTLLTRLKGFHGFNYLANLTAVDYKDNFEVVYHLHIIPDNRKIMVKCIIDREDAVLPSANHIWPAADWQEREIYDLMGIRFENHPNLTRILLPDDFEGYPLRKDFQVKG